MQYRYRNISQVITSIIVTYTSKHHPQIVGGDLSRVRPYGITFLTISHHNSRISQSGPFLLVTWCRGRDMIDERPKDICWLPIWRSFVEMHIASLFHFVPKAASTLRCVCCCVHKHDPNRQTLVIWIFKSWPRWSSTWRLWCSRVQYSEMTNVVLRFQFLYSVPMVMTLVCSPRSWNESVFQLALNGVCVRIQERSSCPFKYSSSPAASAKDLLSLASQS